MRSLFALFIALSIALLAGCIPLAATGIGATALLLEDRRSAGIYIEDENIEWKSRAAILNKFSEAHINITSFNLGVLLTGEAPSEQVKMEIAETV
ncbi:MAG: transporter, partial [Betaproteobacteria bacterium]|nr:transporter [Betaproteobacteria bacterium]